MHCHDPLDCWQQRNPAREGAQEVMVEESIGSPLVCAEAIVLGSGDIRIAAMVRTRPGPPPARPAVRHCVYAHDPLLHNPFTRRLITARCGVLTSDKGARP